MLTKTQKILLDKVSRELENGNYHNECKFITDVSKFLDTSSYTDDRENTEVIAVEDLLVFLAEYNWYE